MKSPIWKWGFPEHQQQEKFFKNFKTKIFEKWQTEPTTQRPISAFPLPAEISDKQKDSLRDIFAHIAIKRISFQNEKRVYYSLGRNWTKWKDLSSEIKIADVVLFPIQAKEIQDILSQAQQFDISIRTFNQWLKDPEMFIPKSKTLAIIHLEFMSKIIRFEPELFQINVQPGVKALELQKYLKEQGWELEFDIIGQEHLNALELLQSNHRIEPSIVQLEIHTPSGGISATPNNGLIQQYFNDFTLGIPSEIVLRIQPKSKYTRKIEAQLKDLHDVTKLIELLRHNNITYSNLYSFNYSKNSLVNILDWYKIPEEQPIDFINTFIKKSEEILFKDETKRPIFIALEFQEYHFSISSLLLKVKDLIQQIDGKLISYNLKDRLDQWRKNYPYLENEAEENQIDCLHLSSLIPLDKIEDYQKAIRKQLEKKLFYPAKYSDDLLLFTHLPSSLLQIDYYFFGSTQHRKNQDSFLKLSDYFKELIDTKKNHAYHPEKSSTLNQEIWSSIKKLTDPKHILSNRNMSSSSNFPKKN
ncbi:MAG TPA: FAD-binding protein [Chitinophagales bacterium]|nr:FAD-binding protein [Chitinophagales bacterium]